MSFENGSECAEPRTYSQVLLECGAALGATQFLAALVVSLSAEAAQQDVRIT